MMRDMNSIADEELMALCRTAAVIDHNMQKRQDLKDQVSSHLLESEKNLGASLFLEFQDSLKKMNTSPAAMRKAMEAHIKLVGFQARLVLRETTDPGNLAPLFDGLADVTQQAKDFAAVGEDDLARLCKKQFRPMNFARGR